MRKEVLIILFALLFVACNRALERQTGEPMPPKPDYTTTKAWYTNVTRNPQKSVDVFYILPTCVYDWIDSKGITYQYGDIYNEKQRAAQLYSYELAEDIFGDETNFYAPYYRQLTLNVWINGEQQVEKLFPAAMSDIDEAFDNFLETKNNNRPFIIAGFSQGGKGVVELTKGLNKHELERMVAAYIIGYKVTANDMQNPNITPATKADDTGVTICYNSVANVDAINPMISAPELCVNPVNWRSDESVAQITEGITTKVDKTHKVLIVEGIDSEAFYIPELHSLFKLGNYHLQELELYKDHLRENVKIRCSKSVTLAK